MRRLGGLLVAVHRYGRCRARSRDEVLWAGRLRDNLQRTLDEARR